MRYVEWTPEDSDSRRRGRLVVESERNVDFASRQAARRQTLGSSASSRSPLEMKWAAGILRQNFLFMHLSTTTLHQLLQCMEEVTLRAGQTLFEVGDCDDCLYLLVSGQMNTEPRAKAAPANGAPAASPATSCAPTLMEGEVHISCDQSRTGGRGGAGAAGAAGGAGAAESASATTMTVMW